ncbi:Cyclopropane-fatty-acyl-phospholipid synthase [Actinobacteria bacterium OV450]|nr:Cyclopropane-fatty-acyl-phospholipid synthase [Actinobacteria bacterium OV450]
MGSRESGVGSAEASRRTVRQAADRVAVLLGPDTVVLGLGAGCGGSSRALAERFGCRVVALDLSEEHNRRHRATNAPRGLISPACLDDLLDNLPLWADITRRQLLRRGLFHAGRTAV